MCGIVGVISSGGRSVVADLGNGAHFLQHRGPAYAGLFVFDPASRRAFLEKGEGLADDIFKQLPISRVILESPTPDTRPTAAAAPTMPSLSSIL